MANIYESGIFIPYQTDVKTLLITKGKIFNTCDLCNCKIPQGSYRLGKSGGYGYITICLRCAKEFLNNFLKSIEDFGDIARKSLKDLEENKKKYELNNAEKLI